MRLRRILLVPVLGRLRQAVRLVAIALPVQLACTVATQPPQFQFSVSDGITVEGDLVVETLTRSVVVRGRVTATCRPYVLSGEGDVSENNIAIRVLGRSVDGCTAGVSDEIRYEASFTQMEPGSYKLVMSYDLSGGDHTNVLDTLIAIP